MSTADEDENDIGNAVEFKFNPYTARINYKAHMKTVVDVMEPFRR